MTGMELTIILALPALGAVLVTVLLVRRDIQEARQRSL